MDGTRSSKGFSGKGSFQGRKLGSKDDPFVFQKKSRKAREKEDKSRCVEVEERDPVRSIVSWKQRPSRSLYPGRLSDRTITSFRGP